MKKIAVIGCCGAGKSTLARELGAIINLPVIHLDAHYWQPGWRETPTEEWIAKQKFLIKCDRWIVDGNYIDTIDIRLAAADTVIFFDFKRILCLWRVLQRYRRYKGIVRPDMADGCAEMLKGDFLLYVWCFNSIQKPFILSKLKLYEGNKSIIVLSNPQQVKNFLHKLSV